MSPLQTRWFAVMYKGTLERILRCSRRRRVNEADISTPVPVDQHAANYPTTWRKLYGHSQPCVAGVDRHALTSPSVIHCQVFELFGARRSTASKPASL
ncbi:hypothetical protein TNCV_170781 [Trichonephila clavipes]|nr:hypothetical protein TNCV_170781 [Trichonephila clavipes]